MRNVIDINSDVGERLEALQDGSEEELLKLITSANIACGGHAGNEEMMTRVVHLCVKHSVAIGAHPGYPDLEHFGRIEMSLSPKELEKCVFEQVTALKNIARSLGAHLAHVKPHGALYNTATTDESVAKAIASGVRRVDKSLILFGLAGSRALDVWRSEGFGVAGEAFADRRYEPDGTLRLRKFSDALITNPGEAAEQAMGVVKDGIVITVDGTNLQVEADTLCIHSDTPNAVAIVREIRRRLKEAHFDVRPFSVERLL